jgi:hypothetical protein
MWGQPNCTDCCGSDSGGGYHSWTGETPAPTPNGSDSGGNPCGCGSNQFCNFDDDTTGDCESCSGISNAQSCEELGLPALGASACKACFLHSNPISFANRESSLRSFKALVFGILGGEPLLPESRSGSNGHIPLKLCTPDPEQMEINMNTMSMTAPVASTTSLGYPLEPAGTSLADSDAVPAIVPLKMTMAGYTLDTFDNKVWRTQRIRVCVLSAKHTLVTCFLYL